MRAAAVAVLVALACASTASAQTAPQAKAAARAYMAKQTGKPKWSARFVCVSPGGSGAVWRCTWSGGLATVVFRGRVSSVHVLCRAAGTTPKSGCR